MIPGQEDLLEKEMATHSSIVAWKIPWTEEPGRLQSMGSQRGATEQPTLPVEKLCSVYSVPFLVILVLFIVFELLCNYLFIIGN